MFTINTAASMKVSIDIGSRLVHRNQGPRRHIFMEDAVVVSWETHVMIWSDSLSIIVRPRKDCAVPVCPEVHFAGNFPRRDTLAVILRECFTGHFKPFKSMSPPSKECTLPHHFDFFSFFFFKDIFLKIHFQKKKKIIIVNFKIWFF